MLAIFIKPVPIFGGNSTNYYFNDIVDLITRFLPCVVIRYCGMSVLQYGLRIWGVGSSNIKTFGKLESLTCPSRRINVQAQLRFNQVMVCPAFCATQEMKITNIWHVTLTDKQVIQQVLLYLGRIQIGRWSPLCSNCVREIDNLKSVQISNRIEPLSFTLTAPKRPRQFYVFQSLSVLALKSRRRIIAVKYGCYCFPRYSQG